MKIGLCGLVKSENLGEMFIAKSLEYLIVTECHKIDPTLEISFVEADLLGRKDEIVPAKGYANIRKLNYYGYDEKKLPMETFYIGTGKVVRKLNFMPVRNLISRVRHGIYNNSKNYRKRMYGYLADKFKDVDFIVIDGAGLLEYSYNEYQESLYVVSQYASDHGLNVIYNAIGKAGAFDERDYRSTILKKAIQSEAVKYVSARDSLEIVQKCAGTKHQVKLLADAAFWIPEAYDLKPRTDRTKIGIGLIRGNSLSGYGYGFDDEDWVKLFSDIAVILKEKGYEFEFFTNGLPGDVKLGRKVLKRLELDDSYLVERPTEDLELLNTINSYKCLITCRMHSVIAATTLRIPSVVLSWNDKVNKLMDIMETPERAINMSDFRADYVVDCMEKALAEGVPPESLEKMRGLALESVRDYAKLIVESGKKNEQKTGQQ